MRQHSAQTQFRLIKSSPLVFLSNTDLNAAFSINKRINELSCYFGQPIITYMLSNESHVFQPFQFRDENKELLTQKVL